MIFQPTNFEDVWLVELTPKVTPLGYLARTYCEREFRSRNLQIHWPQCNESFTPKAGSIRGMHWQKQPHGEAKLVRCLRGGILDVIVDIRQDSKTFGRYQSFSLSDSNLMQLYIPAGFAHGFQTLTDDCVLHYQMGAEYRPELSAGLRWNDPEVAIEWPLPVTTISDRDKSLPLLRDL